MSSTKDELIERYKEAVERYSESYKATGDARFKYAADNIELKESHLNSFYVYNAASSLADSSFKVFDGQVYTEFGMTDHMRAQIHNIPRGSEYQVSWLHVYENDLPDVDIVDDDGKSLLRVTHIKGVQARWASFTRFRPKSGPLSSDSDIEDALEGELGGSKYGRNLVSIDSLVFRTLNPDDSKLPPKENIFGANGLDLHCINKILHNNKRKLLDLPVGVHKSVADIEPMVRRGKDVQLAIHNRLTHMLGLEPLYIVGLKGKKRIDIVNQFSHFTQCLLKNKDIEAVKYVSGIDPESLGDAFNIVSLPGQYEPEILGYTQLIDGKLMIVKTYRPPAHESDPMYYTCYNEASYYFKRFVNGNGLKRLSKMSYHTTVIPLVAESIVFPPILKRAKFCGNMIELDRNKAFPSSIVGNLFPTESLVVGGFCSGFSKTRDIDNPCLAFVIIDKIVSLTRLAKFYFTGASLSVIPAPMYRYLVSLGCHFEASQALYSVMKHITLDCPVAPKTLRNTVIGKLIQSHDVKTVTLPHVNKAEFESLAYTASQQGLVHEPLYFGNNVIGEDDPYSTIEMRIHCAPKPAYQHIYSFIMAYHNIAMLKKMQEFEFDSIKAVYVDAIFIDNSVGKKIESSNIEGEFKLDKIKPYHCEKPISKNVEWASGLINTGTVSKSLPSIPMVPSQQVTWITGPAGSGKSYPWLSSDGQCILTPTCELRDAFKSKGAKNVHTAAKMFQFSMSDAAYASRAHSYYQPLYVIDEFTMFTREQFETMLRRQPNSFFIMLGDTCQICSSVNGGSILPMVSNPIDWSLHTTVRRQSGEFCEFLDSLRDMSIKEQTEAVKSYFTWGHQSECDIVIGGSWNRLSNVNDWFMDQRMETEIIPVKKTKAGGSSVRGFIGKSENVSFHIRRSFAEAKQPVEVAFASTVDSYQGSTLSGKVGILVDDLNRPGALYTAVTRVTSKCQIVLLG